LHSELGASVNLQKKLQACHCQCLLEYEHEQNSLIFGKPTYHYVVFRELKLGFKPPCGEKGKLPNRIATIHKPESLIESLDRKFLGKKKAQPGFTNSGKPKGANK
jgi:hypothetical protein